MSKHQACFNCRRDFVGPDSKIGENVCPECERKLYGGYLDEIAALTADKEKLKEKLKSPFRDLDWHICPKDGQIRRYPQMYCSMCMPHQMIPENDFNPKDKIQQLQAERDKLKETNLELQEIDRRHQGANEARRNRNRERIQQLTTTINRMDENAIKMDKLYGNMVLERDKLQAENEKQKGPVEKVIVRKIAGIWVYQMFGKNRLGIFHYNAWKYGQSPDYEKIFKTKCIVDAKALAAQLGVEVEIEE